MGFKDRQAARQGVRQDHRQDQVNNMTAEQRAKAQGRKDNARAEVDRFKVCKEEHICMN